MSILAKLRERVRRIWRSAITGRFVSKDYAKEHPETTVSEEVRK